MAASDVSAPLADCDVHTPVPTVAALEPWLPPVWRDQLRAAGFSGSGAVARSYPPGSAPSGGPGVRQTVGPGEVAAARDALLGHLDRNGCRYAVLHTFAGLEALKNPDLAAELARAINAWLQEEWLAADPRLRAALVVPPNDPQAAAREVERLGGEPGFVQVLLPARAEQPYGQRRHFPLHDAAAAHGMPLAIHFGGMPGTPPTPSGWSAYYLEDYVGMAQVFQSHVTSLVAEGAFSRLPELRVVLVEAGFSWVPSMLWRLDKEWKGLRREVPWVTEPPSAYVRRHVRATLQPVDVPADAAVLDELLTHIGSDDYLLWSSDHPHVHTTDPLAVLDHLSPARRQAVAVDNARALYQFD
jgi:predicted TIM-barrel fold metal-dependent hydrolase